MIYIIQGSISGNLKIGYRVSKNPESRIKGFRTGHYEAIILLGTIPGSISDEKSIHAELKHYNIKIPGAGREWFRGAPELCSLVKKVIDNQLPWYAFREIRTCGETQLYKEWIQAFSVPPENEPAYEVYSSDDIIFNMNLQFWDPSKKQRFEVREEVKRASFVPVAIVADLREKKRQVERERDDLRRQLEGINANGNQSSSGPISKLDLLNAVEALGLKLTPSEFIQAIK